MDVNSVLKCDLEQNKLDSCYFNTAIQFEISDDIRKPISRGKGTKVMSTLLYPHTSLNILKHAFCPINLLSIY